MERRMLVVNDGRSTRDVPLSHSKDPSRGGGMFTEIHFDPSASENTNRACLPTTIPDLVHARAIETPDAPAVAAGPRTLTYRELDAHANRLGGMLRSRGAGPDAVIGVLANRSPEMIAGALAIWKAGAAYLPLDVSYPSDRLKYIANDARCTLLMCARGLSHPFAENIAEAVPIDLCDPTVATPPAVEHTAEHLAYLIYTSGSTGRPKGVEISHASLLNLLAWHQATFDVRPSDRASQVAAVGFDAAVWETWPYLAAGGSVHIPDDAVRSEPQALRDWLVSQGVTVAFVPTAIAERLVAMPWPQGSRLRILLTGGDTLHSYPPAGLPFLLVNNYGPTECTVVATSGPIHSCDQPDVPPTIGRPIDNTQVHILDEDLRPVPVGSVGEIHIGGAGLARGYRNQPELTAARFIANPFQPGARLYKTGDLARYLPDGRIAFVGRADEQIKIRGFRIEPNEIVAALNAYPGIAASAVVAGEMGGGEKRLVAYVVPLAESLPTKSELQIALRSRLPEFMVPAVFVRLDALPIGLHGKIDRRALPEPSSANVVCDAARQGPRGAVEEYVAGLVKTLLQLDQVGVDDNFFLLGGHSLLGTQLIARIGNVFEIDMSLRSVFEAPTVAQLSAKVEQLLIARVESMTEDDARRILEQRSEAGP